MILPLGVHPLVVGWCTLLWMTLHFVGREAVTWLPWLAAAALVCGSWSPNQMRVQFRRSMDVNTRGSHKIQCLKSTCPTRRKSIRYPSQAGRALVLFVVASIANSKIRFGRFGGREFNAAKSGAIHYRIGSNGSNFRLVLF